MHEFECGYFATSVFGEAGNNCPAFCPEGVLGDALHTLSSELA